MFQRLRNEITRQWHALPLVTVLAIGTVLRFYHLSSLPNGFNQDEAVNGYDAYSIAYTLRDHHGAFLPILLQSFGDWVSPTLTYFTVPFMRVLGLTVLATRLPVAIFGILTVLLAFVFVVQLTGQKSLGLLAALLLAVMPWAVALSRWAIPPSIVPFCLLASLVTFYWAKSDDSLRSYWKFSAFVVSAIALTYAYPPEKVFAPILVLALCAIFLLQKRTIGRLLFVLISYTACVSPLYLLALSDPAKYNARFNGVSLFAEYHSYGAVIAQFASRYVQYLMPDFNFGMGDPDQMHHVPGAPSSYSFLAPLFYLGALFSVSVIMRLLRSGQLSSLSRLPWRDHVVLLVWLIAAPLAASVTTYRDHLLRVVQYLPLVIIYAVVGLSVLLSGFKWRTPRVARELTGITCIVVLCGLVVSFSGFFVAYFQEYRYTSMFLFQHGVKEAIDYTVLHQSAYKHIYIDSNINQPYIFYLFFSSYDPSKIDYAQLNASGGQRLGKYSFVPITALPKGSIRVYAVKDAGVEWYILSAHGDDLYVQRQDSRLSDESIGMCYPRSGCEPSEGSQTTPWAEVPQERGSAPAALADLSPASSEPWQDVLGVELQEARLIIARGVKD